MTVAPTPAHAGRGPRGAAWIAATLAGFVLGALAVALLYHYGVFTSSSRSATEGSGVAATQTRHVPAFASVELAGSNSVVVRVGARRSVVVQGDDNLLDRVTTKVQGGNLVVGNTPGSFAARSPMRVEVTVPALAAVTLSGSGNMVVEGIEAKALAVRLPGSGTLTGSGSATRLDVTIAGSGVARLTSLSARAVHAAVTGSGSIFVTATRSLDASISGSGAIVYAGGPPHVTRSVTGSGTIAGG